MTATGPTTAHWPSSQDAGQSRTALVVEDDLAVQRMLERHLVRAGYRVRGVTGARAALAVAGDVDVAVVDLALAEGSGDALCEQLRAGPATASLPLIVLTARDDLATKLRLFAAGADDYLTKPFEPLELLARLEAHGRRAGPARGWRRIGPLEVSAAGDALLRGAPLTLTAAEREILAHLAAQHPGAAAHEALRRGAWRRSDQSTDNVIEVIVARIRKKLAAAGGGVEIHAVRGAGYVLKLSRPEEEARP
jgi:DNA-binding response OmpR family regulator